MDRSASGFTEVAGACAHGNEPSVFVNLIFVYNTEVYMGHSKFVTVLNCAPPLTADGEFQVYYAHSKIGNILRCVVRLTPQPLYYRRQWHGQHLTRTFCGPQTTY